MAGSKEGQTSANGAPLSVLILKHNYVFSHNLEHRKITKCSNKRSSTAILSDDTLNAQNFYFEAVFRRWFSKTLLTLPKHC